MSANLSFKIVVRGFESSPDTGRLLLGVLTRLLEQHGLTDDVFVDLMGDLGNLRVEAETSHPVVIAGAGTWRPKFEQELTAAMKGAYPAAVTQFDWSST
jgi:hypothetical protein